ncbi:zinc finger BED domain-containing protein DAYSLEEPER-like [Prosopis cineraria]|uniref:zinc finger BED domain-containing protein DAYSLEEPER-like n=1 Tax=Prosopis cineraria TaxID=364024 RepID=UPI00240EC8A2|nr:zinc finger BED domain-containing protein DAYSLEEPER-like [Prosopis cineraria]
MAVNDTNYKFGLTNDEWARADAMCSFLRPFEKITRLISRLSYPTSNFYFMQISKIEMLLDANMKSPDPVIQEMARKMKQKFDKYWNEYSVILALAIVFDPRWKFNIIQYCYTKIDPITCHEKVANIKSKLIFMFNEYSSMGTSTNLEVDGATSGSSYKASIVTTHHSSLASSVSTSTSFDDAFDEPILKPDSWKELDVLNWWKSNQHRYPILSRMAADILSIPITTVASESAFSIGSRVLTKYRSFILPANVQAIICVRNWLHGFVYNGEEEEEESLDIFAPDEPAISESQSNFVELDDSKEEDNDDATNV